MSTVVEHNGVVIDWPDLRRLDTREMRWEDFPGLAGTKIKVLSRRRARQSDGLHPLAPGGGFPVG